MVLKHKREKRKVEKSQDEELNQCNECWTKNID